MQYAGHGTDAYFCVKPMRYTQTRRHSNQNHTCGKRVPPVRYTAVAQTPPSLTKRAVVEHMKDSAHALGAPCKVSLPRRTLGTWCGGGRAAGGAAGGGAPAGARGRS